jgi:uncharacterized membrane protein YgcG
MRATAGFARLGAVSDHWLQHGHETDGVELTRVLSSSTVLADGVGASPPPRFTSGWRGVVVGGAVAVAATVGVVGVANAISDNLFPSLGATTPASVWQNPVPSDEAIPDADVAPTTTSPTSTPTIASAIPPTQAAPSSTVAAPALSPTTSTPARDADVTDDDDDVVVTTLLSTQGDGDEPDDTEPDDNGSDDAGSSGSSGSGDSSGSLDSGPGDSSGSGSSGSDDSSTGSGSDDD